MNFKRFKLIIGLCLMAAVGLTGCRTTDEANTGHMASVDIRGHSASEIKKALARVCADRGFDQVDELTFEKHASTWDAVNYGGWALGQTWVRIRADVLTPFPAEHTVSCDAFAVQSHGQATMEDEHKYVFAKRSECKEILDALKAALAVPSNLRD